MPINDGLSGQLPHGRRIVRLCLRRVTASLDSGRGIATSELQCPVMVLLLLYDCEWSRWPRREISAFTFFFSPC